MVIDTDNEHLEVIRRNGIVVTRGDGHVDVATIGDARLPEQVTEMVLNRVLVATKAQHVPQAAEWLAPRLAADGFAVLCQNGDSYAGAAARLGPSRVVPAFINFAADVVAHGMIRFGGDGAMAIGENDGTVSSRVTEIVADLSGFGEVVATDNVQGYLWAKRGFAAMLSATALVDAPIADLVDEHRQLMAALATEVYRVAQRVGIRLETFDAVDGSRLTSPSSTERAGAFDELVAWLRSLRKDRSGVFRDLAVRRRQTEAVPELRDLVRRGDEAGVSTPLLARLASILAELERGNRSFGPHNIQELTTVLPVVSR